MSRATHESTIHDILQSPESVKIPRRRDLRDHSVPQLSATDCNIDQGLGPPFSTAVSERVEVRCASAGHVAIDLFNTRDASSLNDPLVVHLPPFPGQNNIPQLPSFLRDLPVASINYRWSPYSKPSSNTDVSYPLHWPTPLHDTSFAMAWLLKHLSPGNKRRDIYVYGSYLGASLATSLALTETKPNARFGVRGLIAYNGIYNWTMFLPDHQINKASKSMKASSPPPGPVKDSHLYKIHQNVPALFQTATNLFDPFASPSLFFHSPSLDVPESFSKTADDEMEESKPKPTKAPRKSHLVFPPKYTLLKIPQTLIVYESVPPPASVKVAGKSKAKTTRRRTKTSHTFESQADELLGMMRRSVVEVEMKQRVTFDQDVDSSASEAIDRVQMHDAGPETGSIEPSDAGCEVISSWIENTF
ncbi:hypothetical protein E4U55_002444 [Claviceps digitariae]|nr:hypothetical protein E4U55_002444 [Claviceps digitariae]